MKYTVVRLPNAKKRLAEIWNQASDRKAVSQAANRIDRLLRTDPDGQGNPYLDKRILFELPLAITFAVYPDDCLVEVLQVQHLNP